MRGYIILDIHVYYTVRNAMTGETGGDGGMVDDIQTVSQWRLRGLNVVNRAKFVRQV